jgi:hypothetical protein
MQGGIVIGAVQWLEQCGWNVLHDSSHVNIAIAPASERPLEVPKRWPNSPAAVEGIIDQLQHPLRLTLQNNASMVSRPSRANSRQREGKEDCCAGA